MKHEFLNNFILGVNLFLAAGKHFIKIIFDNKIEIAIFEISNLQNFSNL